MEKIRLYPTLLILLTILTASARQQLTIKSHNERGFAITHGERLLAHGDTPIDTATACPAFHWWMNAMKKVLENGDAEVRASKPDPTKYPPSVGPLLTSTWGQKPPYNYMCPLVEPTPWEGYLPGQQHCLAGCVAVAMGQLMRYHRWPIHGEGEHSIQYQGTIDLTVNFGEATYDWDNMLDDYSTDYTETEGRAVAQLLYHCAVSTDMVFNKSWSFSTNFTAAKALATYFGYDPSTMSTCMRYFYTRNQWMEMVYEELSQGRPIFYEAIDIEGNNAHSFVIDGYDEQGLVHVNWGWYGHENGYYDISLLNPQSYQFDDYQDMTIGIKPEGQYTGIESHPDYTPASDVYTPDGRLVRRNATSLNGLPVGIYIWKGRKTAINIKK